MLTIDQARVVAAKGIPVMFRGTQYMRITSVGWGYDDHYGEHAQVVLEDRSGRSSIRVRPEEVTMQGADVNGAFYYFEGEELKKAVAHG